jgi:hypothetical protein
MEQFTEARQGDVYVQKAAKLPEGCKPVDRDNGRVVLAYGEVTGHAHAFKEEHVRMFSNDNGRRFLVIEGKPATLLHEEHSPILFAPGIYEIWQQREWTDDNEPRTVAD